MIGVDLESKVRSVFPPYREANEALDRADRAARSRANLAGKPRHIHEAVREARLELDRRLGQDIARICVESVDATGLSAGETVEEVWPDYELLLQSFETKRLDAEDRMNSVDGESHIVEHQRALLLHFGAVAAAEPLKRQLAELLLRWVDAPIPPRA